MRLLRRRARSGRQNGGDRNRHHFARQPDEVTANCATVGDTTLHILGKEIIARHGRVAMPETWLTDLDGNRLVVTPRRSSDLTDIHLETAVGELVPDIIARHWKAAGLALSRWARSNPDRFPCNPYMAASADKANEGGVLETTARMRAVT